MAFVNQFWSIKLNITKDFAESEKSRYDKQRLSVSEDDQMTLGQRLRERRRELGLTLKQLSDATDLSIAYLSDVERDKADPPTKTLVRIADGLRTTNDALLASVDEKSIVTDEALPYGLRQLKDDADYGTDMDDEWLKTLMKVDYRGNRPQSKQEWLELHFFLKRLLQDKTKSS